MSQAAVRSQQPIPLLYDILEHHGCSVHLQISGGNSKPSVSKALDGRTKPASMAGTIAKESSLHSTTAAGLLLSQ